MLEVRMSCFSQQLYVSPNEADIYGNEPPNWGQMGGAVGLALAFDSVFNSQPQCED